MFDLRTLYQEVILDHNRQPRNFGCLKNPSHHAEGFNPLCGDQLTLDLIIIDGTIKDIKFEGNGCAISIASASLMTERLLGKTVQETQDVFMQFHLALTSDKIPEVSLLGKLTALLGVKDYPARIKCATLAWHALKSALSQDKKMVSTE